MAKQWDIGTRGPVDIEPLDGGSAICVALWSAQTCTHTFTMATTKRQPWLTWHAVSMKFCFLPRCKRRIMEGSGRPTHYGALSIPGIRTEPLSGPRSLDEE